MTRRRLGLLLSLIAGLCLLGGLFGPGTASADRNGKVELAIGGRPFTSQPTGPLVDTSRLAPGIGVSATFGVRSRFDVATTMSLQLTNIRDDDNGCGAPEARVDTTCGKGQGDLGHHLIVTIAEAPTRDGQFHQVWQGQALQLTKILSLGVQVPGNTDRWLRLSAAVPASVGNIVESDTFRFGLQLVLAGNGVSGGSGVAGQHTGNGNGGHSGSSSGIGGLAATGFGTTLFVTGGVLLLIAGAVLLSAGRKQRRATSAWSSRARRAPRPTSPR
jgi:hypothetical protein